MNEKFETVGKAYAVFSVRELRKLLKQATAGAHAKGLRSRRAVGNHCIVMTAALKRDSESIEGRDTLIFESHYSQILGIA